MPKPAQAAESEPQVNAPPTVFIVFYLYQQVILLDLLDSATMLYSNALALAQSYAALLISNFNCDESPLKINTKEN